jgi:tetratricopeptide (TPR) repeat protein
MLVQGNQRDHGAARSYRILGEIELAKERISEAVDYFGFAAESAERSHDSFEAMLSDVNAAATQFLLGNYSKAERHAIAAGKRASESYLEQWEHWAKFMVARVRFETGRYKDAEELFDSLRLAADYDGRADYRAILDAWTNRTRVYVSGPQALLIRTAPNVGDTEDGLLFKAESALLCGDHERARAFADAYLSLSAVEHSHNPECVSWRSGFSLVEDRVIGNSGEEPVGRKLARVIRGLATAELGAPREALVDIYHMAKEERISPCDPYDALYFRALFLILRHAGTPEVDRGTVLSIAFKRLQKRASHIDDPETKRSYINQNRWNGALFTEAKAGNLI